MIQPRRSKERGHFNHGWLDTYHTFSFSDYHDPKFMGFRTLRVINEDRVEAGEGFPTHSHRDMEIITYIIEGALEHKDSMGTGSVIKPGDVQRMSAGTGVTHSEYNPSKEKPVHLLQIWILPEKPGLKPSYEESHFEENQRKNKLCLVASSEPKNGAVKVHQDIKLFVSLLDKDKELAYSVNNRHAWLQVVRGVINCNGTMLYAGDGAAISSEKEIKITAVNQDSEFLFFDLA